MGATRLGAMVTSTLARVGPPGTFSVPCLSSSSPTVVPWSRRPVCTGSIRLVGVGRTEVLCRAAASSTRRKLNPSRAPQADDFSSVSDVKEKSGVRGGRGETGEATKAEGLYHVHTRPCASFPSPPSSCVCAQCRVCACGLRPVAVSMRSQMALADRRSSAKDVGRPSRPAEICPRRPHTLARTSSSPPTASTPALQLHSQLKLSTQTNTTSIRYRIPPTHFSNHVDFRRCLRRRRRCSAAPAPRCPLRYRW